MRYRSKIKLVDCVLRICIKIQNKKKGKHVDYLKIRRNLELESYGQGHYC